jgi:hypothetical protein
MNLPLLPQVDPENPNRREHLERELLAWGAALDHMSRAALATLLAGPLLDADTKRPQGPVLTWADRLLRHANSSAPAAATGTSPSGLSVPVGAPGPFASLAPAGGPGGVGPHTLHLRLLGVTGAVQGAPRSEVARAALLNLLQVRGRGGRGGGGMGGRNNSQSAYGACMST